MEDSNGCNFLCGSSIKDYKLEEEIGSGGFATVYRAKCSKGHDVAIKKIDRDFVRRKKLEDRVNQEICIHKELKHENIVQCYTTFKDENYIYLVLELCKCTLDEYIKEERQKGLLIQTEKRKKGQLIEDEGKKKGPLLEVVAHDIIKQVVEGMVYLHDKLIIHRDLSLRNILLKGTNEVKISDFGFATKLSHKKDLKCSVLGTPNFQSPEIHKRAKYGFKTDSWSLGCVVFAVLGGKLPFDRKHVEDVITATLTSDIQKIIPKYFKPEAKKLVIDLLKQDDSKRISVAGVLESSFFKKYDSDKKEVTRINGSEYSLSRTKNGSYGYGDSGLGSTNNSSATYKYRSLKNLDSGLDSSNSGFNELMRCRDIYNTTHLDTIQSSGHSYQNSDSKSRSKHGFKRGLKPSSGIHDENVSQKSKECSEKYRSLKLKNHIQALPSRQSPFDRVSPYEEIDHIGFPVCKVPPEEKCLSEATNQHYPLPIAYYSDKRERSVSEERRKQENRRIQSLEEEYTSHQNIDKLKRSRKKSNERRSQHCSPHKHKSHSSNYSHHSRSNMPTDKCEIDSCRFNHSLFEDKCDNQSSQFLHASSEKHMSQEKCSLHQQNLPGHCLHISNDELNSLSRKNLQSKKIQRETSTLEKKPLPLNAERLRPCRYPMKKIAVVSILEKEKVCVEWLKTKKGIQYVSDVLMISDHGEWISIYKPRNCLVGDTPPPIPENHNDIKDFSYDNLDKTYWKMYRKAKVLVDFVRATTPKITYYDKNSKCVMMENYPDPDFELEFFDGGSITQKSNKVTLTDEWGKSILLTEVNNLDTYFTAMWEKFCEMKDWCKNMEAQLEALKIFETKPYPVMFGNPPLEKKLSSAKDNFKENNPHHSAGPSMISKTNRKSKSYEEIKRYVSDSSSKYLYNSEQHMTLPSSKPVSNIEAIFRKLKSKPKLINGEVRIEYIDGCVVCCSKDEKEVKIYNSRNNCIYDSRIKSRNESYSKLIDMVLQDLPCIVSVAVYSTIARPVT